MGNSTFKVINELFAKEDNKINLRNLIIRKEENGSKTKESNI